MEPPGPAGYIDGTRPYFLSVGQSEGPIRSKPLQPSRAASRQQSSSDMFRAKTPRVTACLSRALRPTTAGPGVCANVVVAAAARLRMNSLRRMVFLPLIQHDESKQGIAGGDNQILRTIEFISDRTIAQTTAKIGMPQRVAGSGIQSHEISGRIASEDKISGGA